MAQATSAPPAAALAAADENRAITLDTLSDPVCQQHHLGFIGRIALTHGQAQVREPLLAGGLGVVSLFSQVDDGADARGHDAAPRLRPRRWRDRDVARQPVERVLGAAVQEPVDRALQRFHRLIEPPTAAPVQPRGRPNHEASLNKAGPRSTLL